MVDEPVRDQAASDPLDDEDDPNHARLRAFAQPAFTPRRVASLELRIKKLCDELLDEMAAFGDGLDLVRAFTGPMPALVIAELLGVPRSDFRTFQRIANDVILLGTPETAEKGYRAMAELGEYYAALVAAKARTGSLGDDLTSDFIRAKSSGAQFSDHELVAMGPLFLVAGHETTTNLLNNVVRCLSENPEAKAFLLADLGRAPMLIEEVLRCRGPATGAPRIARRDIELHGVTIPAGSRVWPPSLSANRDPRVFENPERFIPDRNPKNILSFGRGIHKCLGEPLARLEAKIAGGGVRTNPWFVSTCLQAATQMVLAGRGIGLFPDVPSAPLRDLVPILPEVGADGEIFLSMGQRLSDSARGRRVQELVEKGRRFLQKRAGAGGAGAR